MLNLHTTDNYELLIVVYKEEKGYAEYMHRHKLIHSVLLVVLLAAAGGVGTMLGYNNGYDSGYDHGYDSGYRDIEILTPSQEEIDFEQAVVNLPRGTLGLPAQWYMMKSTLGWEKMMLIFGYANNRQVCSNMVIMGREETPLRDFKCVDAN